MLSVKSNNLELVKYLTDLIPFPEFQSQNDSDLDPLSHNSHFLSELSKSIAMCPTYQTKEIPGNDKFGSSISPPKSCLMSESDTGETISFMTPSDRVNKQNKQGETAFHISARHGMEIIIKYLCNVNGGNLNRQNNVCFLVFSHSLI